MGKEKSTPEQDYFNANKESKVVYGTSDGNLFEDKYFAKIHGDTLEEGKREIETFKNPLFIEVETEKEEE